MLGNANQTVPENRANVLQLGLWQCLDINLHDPFCAECLLGLLQAAALLEQDPETSGMQGQLGTTTEEGADVLQLEDSGSVLDINLHDAFCAECLLGLLQAATLLEQDPETSGMQGQLGTTTEEGADVLQLEDSGDALDIDLDDPFQAQMLDITQPIVADETMLKRLKQQVGCSHKTELLSACSMSLTSIL